MDDSLLAVFHMIITIVTSRSLSELGFRKRSTCVVAIYMNPRTRPQDGSKLSKRISEQYPISITKTITAVMTMNTTYTHTHMPKPQLNHRTMSATRKANRLKNVRAPLSKMRTNKLLCMIPNKRNPIQSKKKHATINQTHPIVSILSIHSSKETKRRPLLVTDRPVSPNLIAMRVHSS